MPGVVTLNRGTTATFSWYAVDSTLPFTVNLNDRRTGTFIVWNGNRYTVRIGATTTFNAHQDGQFQCLPASATTQGNPILCKT